MNINVDPSIEIPPYVTLEAGLTEFYSNTSYIANLDEIKAVCTSGDYIARSSAREGVASTNELLPKPSSTSTLSYPLPNPTSGNSTLSFTLAENSGWKLELSNAVGVRVKTVAQSAFAVAGKYSAEIDTHNLEAGVYYLTFTSEGFRQARKLVVVK